MDRFYIDYREGSVDASTERTPVQKALPFHVCSCGRIYSADRYFVNRDGREDYLLLLTTEGQGRVFFRGESCILEAGTAVLINCREYHEYSCAPGNIWNFYYTHFDGKSMESFQQLVERLNPVKLSDPRTAENMLEEIYTRSIQSVEADYYRQSHLLSGLLTEMICGQAPEHPVVRREITRLAEYIRIHFAEELHLDELAERAGYSRFYLIRLFQQQFGVSPYRYLNRCRIRHSEFLLRSTDRTVAQIGESVGYSSPELFIRHFRALHGMTPGEFRRKQD